MTISESVQLEKLLKSTAHGRIYLARDQESGQRRIYREFEGTGEVYRKLAQLHSPHLPQVYEVREEGERTAVVEEYIPGDTLAFLLEKGCLPEPQAAEILCQLCDALTVLHQAGIVHRDIKPENIILRGNELVLIDFNVSRVSHAAQDTDTRILGTTGYAAPEQYGFSQTDARADLYAAGVMFNEILTGQHPSRELTKGPFRLVVERCIEVNVDMRYQTAAELRGAVLRRLRYRKHRKIRLAIVGAALAVALALGLYAALRPEPVVPQIALSAQAVPEDARGFTTPFSYDLDGDGVAEEYIFGTLHQNIPAGYQHTLSDSFGISGEDENERSVFPCVWKTEEDGSISPVPEFAELLTNAQVELCRAEGSDSPAPEIYPADGSVWPGGIRVVYSVQNLGSWYYSASADLDGQHLTSATTSHVFDLSKQFQ